MAMKSAGGYLVMFLMMASMTGHAAGREQGQMVLQPFGYRGVTLLDSRLKMQFDEVRDYYLRLPNDDILRGYRLRAGLPASGVDLGGCYLGHNTFGQILSGLARMYAATADAGCRDKAEALMQGWAECIAPDGFFFIEKEPQLPPYYYEKMVCGLLDLYVYCGNREALGHLRRITDWAVRNLDRTRLYARPTGPGGGEWYTLSENLYRAYLATGDATYRDFAEVWEYTEFWGLLETKSDIFQQPMNGGWYHAYSHVNSLNGLAAAYLTKGDPRYLQTLRNAYDTLWDTQLWVTGGFGPNETLMPRTALAAMLRQTSNHFETQCGSWAGFKLCRYLIGLTGDARYGDWLELLALNGIGASLPMDPDGSVFYYSEYHLGGSSKQNMAPWACCSGTRAQALADVHDLIYFHDEANLYVNLFIPASVDWTCGGTAVKLIQRTRFPEAATTEFEVHVQKPVEFGLHLRTPAWLASPMTAAIEGQSVPIATDDRHWTVCRRTWHTGERLVIELPMGFSLSRLLPEHEFPAALRYGPVALVARSAHENPSRKIDVTDPTASLEPVPGSPLNYRPKADASILLRPFYQMKKGERYFMYLDPATALVRDSFRAAVFSPGWTDFGSWMATCSVGATARYAFSGAGLTVVGQLYDDAGRLEVAVDGKVLGLIDQYGPHRGAPEQWAFAGLGAGPHTLVLTLLPGRAEQSKGNWVNLTAFEVTP
jgi:hypothetical protein